MFKIDSLSHLSTLVTAPAVAPPPAMVTQSWVQESPEYPMVIVSMTERNIHVLTYLRDGGAGGGDGVADPEAGGVVGHVGDAAVALLRPAATWTGKHKTRAS